MKDKILTLLYVLGAIAVCAGYISNALDWEYAPFGITIGGTLIALAQINAPYKGRNLNLKRLYRKQIFASLFIIASGAAIIYTKGNEWIVLATIAAAIFLYTSFRIPMVEKKEKEETK